MKDLLEYICKNITGEENISVVATKEGEVNVYTINAPQAVLGMLIGKGGKTIKAIRSLARARAIIDSESISVQLQEI